MLEIPQLPPYQPTREYGTSELEERAGTSDYWNIERAQEQLANSFSSPLYRDAVNRFYGSLAPQIAARYQLGYKPIIEPAESDTLIHLPTQKYTALNNRAFHSTKVAASAVDLAQGLGLNQAESFILALAGLTHDYAHPVFSHVGENALVSISQAAEVSDHELHTFLEQGNYTNHEQNLAHIVSDPQYEINEYLRGVMDDEQFRIYKDTIQEKGKLGAVLKLADTSAYLDHDSHFFGFSEPGFNEYFRQILLIQGDTLTLRQSSRSYGEMVVNNFLSYRKSLYEGQYAHPINVLLERMQARALFEYIGNMPNSKTRMKEVHNLFRTPDREAVDLMRRRLLITKSAPNLAFFGMPYSEFSQSSKPESSPDDITQNSITVSGEGVKRKQLTLNTENGQTIKFNGSPNPDSTSTPTLIFHEPNHLSDQIAWIIKTATGSLPTAEDAYLLEYVYGPNSTATWLDINPDRAGELLGLVSRDFSQTLKASEVFTQI